MRLPILITGIARTYKTHTHAHTDTHTHAQHEKRLSKINNTKF